MRERVAVCALTYLRPDGLRRLLDGLAELVVPNDHDVDVVIVDNDPAGSARDAVESRTDGFPHRLYYVNEPARGISHARNAAVATALAHGAVAMCFIDDDEWPDRDWLAEFIASRAETGADIVTGTVLPAFDVPPPHWATAGGFFDRRRHAHHERMGYATTSTVLISSTCFEGRPQPFDPAFGMSGGEDTHLFAQLHAEGRTIVWSDRAVVHEAIPASRVNARWLLRREYRRGQTLSLSLRRRDPSVSRYVRRVGNGLMQIGRGVLRTVVGIPHGRPGWLNGVKQVVFGAGMLTGLAGRRYEEYETIHGS